MSILVDAHLPWPSFLLHFWVKQIDIVENVVGLQRLHVATPVVAYDYKLCTVLQDPNYIGASWIWAVLTRSHLVGHRFFNLSKMAASTYFNDVKI